MLKGGDAILLESGEVARSLEELDRRRLELVQPVLRAVFAKACTLEVDNLLKQYTILS